MDYRIPATSLTPALIIYLLDVSGSMSEKFGEGTKVDVVTHSLQKTIVEMVKRSTRGKLISPRYRVAMFAYSSRVNDLLGGIKTIDELVKMGIPQLTTIDRTNTAAAFAEAETLLRAELPKMDKHPAPLVCHMTDGEYNGSDPSPIAKRIMQMRVPDGNVLVENIYVQESGIEVPNVHSWPGILSDRELPDEYSRTLLQMSSPLPESYRQVINEYGHKLKPGAHLFFPANQPDLVQLGFTVSGLTPTTPGKA